MVDESGLGEAPNDNDYQTTSPEGSRGGATKDFGILYLKRTMMNPHELIFARMQTSERGDPTFNVKSTE
jgi:hypothetical protein